MGVALTKKMHADSLKIQRTRGRFFYSILQALCGDILEIFRILKYISSMLHTSFTALLTFPAISVLCSVNAI